MSISFKCTFLPSVLNKNKNKNALTEYRGHSKHGSPFFFGLGHGVLVLYFYVYVETKFFFNNSNLKNLVDVRYFNDNGKWIICVSEGFILCLIFFFFCCSPLLFRNVSFRAESRYLRFSMMQQFLLCLTRIRSWLLLLIWSGKSFLPKKSHAFLTDSKFRL